MKIKDIIKRLEKYNPEAVLRLGGPEGEEVLFICALAKDDKNVWLESASMCDPNEEIATRFNMVEMVKLQRKRITVIFLNLVLVQMQ